MVPRFPCCSGLKQSVEPDLTIEIMSICFAFGFDFGALGCIGLGFVPYHEDSQRTSQVLDGFRFSCSRRSCRGATEVHAQCLGERDVGPVDGRNEGEREKRVLDVNIDRHAHAHARPWKQLLRIFQSYIVTHAFHQTAPIRSFSIKTCYNHFAFLLSICSL